MASQPESLRTNKDSETATTMPSTQVKPREPSLLRNKIRPRRMTRSDELMHLKCGSIFTKIRDRKRAVCKYCSNSYASDPKKNGTSTMK